MPAVTNAYLTAKITICFYEKKRKGKQREFRNFLERKREFNVPRQKNVELFYTSC